MLLITAFNDSCCCYFLVRGHTNSSFVAYPAVQAAELGNNDVCFDISKSHRPFQCSSERNLQIRGEPPDSLFQALPSPSWMPQNLTAASIKPEMHSSVISDTDCKVSLAELVSIHI